MSGKYRTIVADPPWPEGFWWANGRRRGGRSKVRIYERGTPAYGLMSLEKICELPVGEWADDKAHLFLWVPDLHLIEGNAARVARAWGFDPGRLIVWAKKNPGNGRFPRPAHEAFLVCSRGGLPFEIDGIGSVQHWKQVYDNRGKVHSAKPDAMLDLVEQASPGPYLELFARRARFAWDYYGDESLETAQLPTEEVA